MNMFKTIQTLGLTSLLFAGASLLNPVAAQGNTPPPKPVKVADVKQTSIAPTVDVMATIYSQNQVQVTAGVNGRLTWVAQPGSYVRQGESVAKMDLTPLKLQLAEQQAQVKRAKLNLDYQASELARLQKLGSNASKFDIDQTASRRDIAKSDLEIARLRISQIQDQIARAEVKAPFEGVITERVRFAGEDVNRSTVLARMLDTKNLEARLFVPLKHLPYVTLGNDLTLTSNEFNHSGKVKAIIPSADQRSQTFELRIEIPQDASDHWAAGQLVKVALPINKVRQSLAVHRDALIIRRDGVYVIRIDEENKAKRVKVTVGDGDETWVSVSGDLKEGDKVAIRGAERLRDGEKVEVNS